MVATVNVKFEHDLINQTVKVISNPDTAFESSATFKKEYLETVSGLREVSGFLGAKAYKKFLPDLYKTIGKEPPKPKLGTSTLNYIKKKTEKLNDT